MAVDLSVNVRDFVSQYMTKNPKASSADAMVAAREYYQELKELGAPISKKQLSQVAPLAQASFEQIRANLAPINSPIIDKAVNKQKRTSAANYYYEFSNMSKDAHHARKQRLMQDNKVAYANNDYLEILKRVNPAEYEKELVYRAELDKPVQSNNAGKKEIKEEYQSSQKKKFAKKAAEEQSKMEHAKERKKAKTLDKTQRNASYVTAQGEMTHDAHNAYRKAQSVSDALVEGVTPFHSAKESMRVFEQAERVPSKSAEISYHVFEEAGLLDDVTRNGKPLGDGSGAPHIPVTPTSPTSGVQSVVESAADAGKEVVDRAGKGKWGWIAAGVGLVAAALGGKAYMDSKSEQKLDVAA